MIYTVKLGDTLSTIARDVLGEMDLWTEIARINNVTNSDLIYPGQQLTLPVVLDTVTVTAKPFPWGKLFLVSLAIGGGVYAYKKYKAKKKK